MRILPAVIALAMIVPPAVSAAEPTIKDFARLPEYSLPVLSPTGEYLAAAVPRGDQTGIAIIRLSDMKATAAFSESRVHVSRIWWVAPERVLMTFDESSGALARPTPTGKLMAMNFDGSGRKRLHGFDGGATMADVIAARTKVADEILVSLNSLYQLVDGRMIPQVHKLNTRTGRSFGVADSPVSGFTYFLADHEGELRYAVGQDEKLVDRTFVRNPGARQPTRQWSEFGTSAHERSVVPLEFSRTGDKAYLRARDGTDKYCLNELDVVTKASRALACHPKGDLAEVYFSSDRDVPIAAVFEPGVPEVQWINPEHPDTKLLKALSASFPGQVVAPTSWSDDGSRLVFSVRSDRNPGEFYLYDRKAGSARFLMARRQWIDPAKMAEVKPLVVRTRGGDEVHALLTLPPGKAPQKLPMVVMPHGGPIGPRDDWGWHPDAQFMANRGYAVLQVNFHGSGGYGYRHLEAGRETWGTLMIDDITDAVRATIAAGTTDPQRICIYGGSYGGYAALMSSAREPEIYRCAIGYVGVYDLAKLKRDTDIQQFKQGRTFMDRYIGDDPKLLAEQSPINHLDKLKAPVFIVHGEDDPRAPFNQAKLLRAELDKRKHPYEWMAKANEGHGFYALDNRIELYEKMEDFLGRHIGARAAAAK